MKKKKIPYKQIEKVHPSIPELHHQLSQKRISRREFLHTVTLLGLSAATAGMLAGCGDDTPIVPTPTLIPASEVEAVVQRGGTLRVASQVLEVDYPAKFIRAGQSANQFRQAFEYLTQTDKHGITQPYLLESWRASDDLKTWTLNLRNNVTWTNGDKFTADDVMFNFEQWLDPSIGSSIGGSFKGYLSISGVEKVGDTIIKLNLDKPLVTVPEIFSEYPAQIIPPSFDGNISSGKNPSTGPYVLEEFVVGEKVRFVKRTDEHGEYWQKGTDGEPLPYLDAIEWLDFGDDRSAWISAMQEGTVSTMYNPNIESYQAFRGNYAFSIARIPSAQAQVLRFRVDMEPWTDIRYVRAVKMCQNRQEILGQAYLGQGQLGHDTHVSPAHPEFAPMTVPFYTPDEAKALLTEANDGKEKRLVFEITHPNEPSAITYAKLLQEGASKAGIIIRLKQMSSADYLANDTWLDVPVGITRWTHRPLGIMVLPLAYAEGAKRNESRWSHPEFAEKLQEAQSTLDIEARRQIMVDLQRIQAEEGSIGVAWWMDAWSIFNSAFKNMDVHPAGYNLWNNVWYNRKDDIFA